MKTMMWNRLAGIAAFGVGLLIGCSDTQQPAVTTVGEAALTTENVVTQDLAQLSNVGIPPASVYGVFSVGWNQFVGPAIQTSGTIGKAFAVVHADTLSASVRPVGVDIGTVTLSYGSGSTDLTKRTSPNGNVLYSTFDRGLREPNNLPVNIPFVGGGSYTFTVTGSAGFAPGSFTVTAPASLIDISNPNGGSASLATDLTVSWVGGDPAGDVVVRVVPHFAPRQLQQPLGGGADPRGPRPGGGGPGRMGPGQHQGPGPHQGLGLQQGPGLGMLPVPPNAIVKTVANTGSITLTADELRSLLADVQVSEIMVHVAQVAVNLVEHDGRPYAVLLKDADRVVLKLY